MQAQNYNVKGTNTRADMDDVADILVMLDYLSSKNRLIDNAKDEGAEDLVISKLETLPDR